MTSQYFPLNVRTFTPKVNLQDTVNADDVNSLQTEVYNLEYYLNGTNIAQEGMLTSTWTGTFTQPSSPWSSLSDRLANIEAGLVNGVTTSNSPYFAKSGDAVTALSTVGITVKNGISSNTNNLVETYTYGNVLGFNIDNNGIPHVGAANVVYVNSSDWNTIQSEITAAAAVASSNPFNPFLLAGM